MTTRARAHPQTGTTDNVDDGEITQPELGARVEIRSDHGVQRGTVWQHELVNLVPNSREDPTTPACVVLWADGELSGPIPTEQLTIV